MKQSAILLPALAVAFGCIAMPQAAQAGGISIFIGDSRDSRPYDNVRNMRHHPKHQHYQKHKRYKGYGYRGDDRRYAWNQIGQARYWCPQTRRWMYR
jgi:hypothetical protein